MIDPIQFSGLSLQEVPSTQKTPGTDFQNLVGQGINQLNESLNASEATLRAYAAGESVSVHEMMIAMEKARFSMEFAVQVRNQVVQAYDKLMRMQI